jgi:hypothetical protein
MIGFAVSFSRIELEGDAEDDGRVAAESKLAIEVARVCWHARRHRVFSTVTELMSCVLATEAERGGTRGVTFGVSLMKGRFRIRRSRTKFVRFLEANLGTGRMKLLS